MPQSPRNYWLGGLHDARRECRRVRDKTLSIKTPDSRHGLAGVGVGVGGLFFRTPTLLCRPRPASCWSTPIRCMNGDARELKDAVPRPLSHSPSLVQASTMRTKAARRPSRLSRPWPRVGTRPYEYDLRPRRLEVSPRISPWIYPQALHSVSFDPSSGGPSDVQKWELLKGWV